MFLKNGKTLRGKKFSIIIPARNEEKMIAGAIDCVLESLAEFQKVEVRQINLNSSPGEIIIIDNLSDDKTPNIVAQYQRQHGVKCTSCPRRKAPSARNDGAKVAEGRIFVFMDADTRMPRNCLSQISALCNESGYIAGITRLASLEGGVRAFLWWSFWGQVRRLPLPKAKAMPALMFCTREAFYQWGPFDEEVAIGEEWPILARIYQFHRKKFIYDRKLTALSSNRRMELQRFGYIQTLVKYIWAILHISGRTTYSDQYR